MEGAMIMDELKLEAKAKWQALIAAQESSGMDIPRYCAAKNICRSSFYARRKQLRGRVRQKSGFLRLMPASAEAGKLSVFAMPVNIRTPNGYMVELRLTGDNSFCGILGILKAL